MSDALSDDGHGFWRFCPRDVSAYSLVCDGTFRSVLAVGMIHVICSIPVVAIFLTASVYTKFDVFDPYLGWLTSLMLEIDYLTQAVSQAVNFFVSYNLMAKFKQIFKKHFCCKTGGRE